MQGLAALFVSGGVWSTALTEPALRSTQQEPISDNELCTVGVSADSSVPNFETCAGFTWEIYGSHDFVWGWDGGCLDDSGNHCWALNVLKSRPPKRNHYINYFLLFFEKLWKVLSKTKRGKLTSQQKQQHAEDSQTETPTSHTQRPDVMHLDGTLST